MMPNTAISEMSRAQHAQIIENGIVLDRMLFAPLTLDSIPTIERQLQELREQTGCEYVVVPVGQPYGGPKRPMALPREDIDAAHRAYQDELRGVSPEIGRVYDLQSERERLKKGRPTFNPAHYPLKFRGFLSSHYRRQR
jgi:hypothetical protein